MDLVCGVGISGHESSSLIPVSHSFTRTYTKIKKKKNGTDHDTLKHCQTFDPKISWDTLDDLTKYEGYPNNE